jgi:S-layer protein
MAINTDTVQRLYVAYFNRPADPGGLAYWEGLLPSTTATQAQLAAIANGFSGSAEYAMLYGSLPNTVMVNSLYLNLFGRAAEAAGLSYWAGRLQAGSETFASLALQLTYSAQGTDATAIANKVSAANAFTAEIDTPGEILGYSGMTAAFYARSWLATVTDPAASLTAAISATALAKAVSDATTGVVGTAGQAALWQKDLDAYVSITDGVVGAGANDITELELVGVDTITGNHLPLA